MHIKLILTIIVLLFINLSTSHADIRTEISFGYSTLNLDRHDNDLIGTNEASKWDSPNVSGYITGDIIDTVTYAMRGKYVEYITGGVVDGKIKDDTPENDKTLELSLMHVFSNDSIAAFGINYGEIMNIQAEDDARKIYNGYDLSFVNDLDKFTYMLTYGEVTEASIETQDALRKARYFGLVLDYTIDDQINFGVTYDSFFGDEYDWTTPKSEQRAKIKSIYGERKIGTHTIKAGYHLYRLKRQDIQGNNIGEIEHTDGGGFFISYSVPFGKVSSKKERMLITQQPNITEFVNIGGSTMD